MTQHYHLIGIGGVGMSALAKILLQKGERVSGSDVAETVVTKQLEEAGAKIFYHQNARNIQRRSIVVYSTAIRDSNPELVEAKRLRCRLLHRSDLLQKLLSEKKALVVTGCHGKTTTTMLLSHVLKFAETNPSYVVGGFSPSLGSNGESGIGQWFVVEGDESDGSFLKTDPFGAIVTNVSLDHIDYWEDEARLDQAFYRFCESVQSRSHFIYCFDDPKLQSWNLDGVPYGFSEGADIVAKECRQEGDKTIFTIKTHQKVYEEVELALLGEHNVLNALAVFAMAKALDIEEHSIFAAFKNFSGIARRFERKGEKRGITIYDDYAHHPEEIKRTLATLQGLARKQRKIAIFQPHRFSRLKHFMGEFAEVLRTVDNLIITDVYSAGEDPIEGGSIEDLLAEIGEHKSVHYVPRGKLDLFLQNFVRPKDIVITLGAGDITKAGGTLLENL